MAGAKRIQSESGRREDLDTARLVTRAQAGDREAFAAIYTRYFDRVYAYLKTVLNDHHEAEDAAQEVFIKVMEALPAYQHRGRPFRAWLFVVVRNYALSHLEKLGRLEVADPAELDRRRECAAEDADLKILEWITDRDLLLFVGKLPLPQRQVLLLRYMLDLSNAQIARVLGRSPDDTKMLHHRAIYRLEKRLKAVGRTSSRDVGRADRSGSQRRFQQAEVLRARRFALLE